MSYREFHELPYQSGIKEKFFTLGPVSLSLDESAWVFFGIILSYNMTKHLPPMEMLSFPFSHLYYVIPVLVTYFFAKAKHPRTGISLWKYIGRWLAIRKRERVFYYCRMQSNPKEG
jgi:hypothetical protein